MWRKIKQRGLRVPGVEMQSAVVERAPGEGLIEVPS